mgnify:FL=1
MYSVYLVDIDYDFNIHRYVHILYESIDELKSYYIRTTGYIEISKYTYYIEINHEKTDGYIDMENGCVVFIKDIREQLKRLLRDEKLNCLIE